ncbi:trehalose-phosphatase [Egibacter rhizosphaerae]|uniref:Trehalose 6-phosphate phosphatase n=1 Tax=Egibacter rhizosphaerae TaxID=1670831 RepID=A0A411YAP9_9ACTN|nr:trehalose-phosphatase [Egibacter rhizosphaerae]QBI18284.1 trehalose-phosphatase [Egibacter rhizosphaerae]
MTPEEAAQRLAADPGRTALCCDFDGTLAPIVDDPADSALPEGTREALWLLARRLGRVALVSGRPAGFLLERAAIEGIALYGLYGLEEAEADGTVRPHPDVAPWEDAVGEAKAWLATELDGHPGIVIEDKGRSVAVHWRHALDHARAELIVGVTVDTIAEATGLTAEPGKLVAELRPPVPVDKGDVVARVAADAAVVAYAGDDRGDIPAFAAARRRGGIAIGVDHGVETADEVRAACDVLLDGVAAFGTWLDGLAARLAP